MLVFTLPETLTTEDGPDSWTGLGTVGEVVPSPTCPNVCKPQPHVEPSDVIARE